MHALIRSVLKEVKKGKEWEHSNEDEIKFSFRHVVVLPTEPNQVRLVSLPPFFSNFLSTLHLSRLVTGIGLGWLH